MDFYTDLAVMYLEKGLVFLVSAFVVASYILFIVDLIKAKKEHRKVKLGFKIMLIISLIINALFIIGVVFLVACLVLYMFSWTMV